MKFLFKEKEIPRNYTSTYAGILRVSLGNMFISNFSLIIILIMQSILCMSFLIVLSLTHLPKLQINEERLLWIAIYAIL